MTARTPVVMHEDGTWVLPAGPRWNVPLVGPLMDLLTRDRRVEITDTHVTVGSVRRAWTEFDAIWLTGGIEAPERLTLIAAHEAVLVLETEAQLSGTEWTVDGLHRFAVALSHRTGLPLRDDLPDWRTWIEHSVGRFEAGIEANRLRVPHLHVLDAVPTETPDVDGTRFTIRNARMQLTAPFALHLEVRRNVVYTPDGHVLPLEHVAAVGVTYHATEGGTHRGLLWALLGDRQAKLLGAVIGSDGRPAGELNAIARRIRAYTDDAREHTMSHGDGSDVPRALQRIRRDGHGDR